ncbi:MAG: DUF5012 domain-containing protein [Bacteroidaceae bacterium]|nr:DUF5012 domain-containing protein [Bacteroidaceae bacterium]
MKKITITALGAILLLSMAGCQKITTEGVTRTTYYPVITLEGDSYMIIDKDSKYEEPGYSATLNGQDVTSDVEVNSNVNTAVSGVYSVSYSAVNEDGFSASSTRTVVVLDPNDPVEGFYLSDPSCNRGGTLYGKQYEILILNEGDGTYFIEDGLAGWYWLRAGYGTSYKMETSVSISDDGVVSLVDSYIDGWGDGLDSLEGTYDFTGNTLKYTAKYAGSLVFNVVLNKE